MAPNGGGRDLEGVHACKAVAVRHEAVVQEDVGVLHTAKGNLVLDLGGAQPLHALAQDEGVDFPSGRVPGPVDYDVGKSGIAYPPFSPIQDPAALHLYSIGIEICLLSITEPGECPS